MFIRKDEKNGKVYYRYRYRDKDGKLLSVPLKDYQHLDYTNLEVMKAHLKYYEAKFDAIAKERDERESWHDKYHNFQSLLEIYINEMKKNAPRSWESKTSWFENYVLPFFLNQKGAASLEDWKMHFNSFKEWLSIAKQHRARNKSLSLNSQNHCITELNNFLKVMADKGHCETQKECSQFKETSEESLKSLDNVFSNKEITEMYHFLRKRNIHAAHLFILLLHTGARIQEALGWNPLTVSKSKIPHKGLNRMLDSLKMPKYQIHMYFDRQLDNPGVVKKDEEVLFVPLKGKKEIHERHMRYVPLFNCKAEKIVATRMRRAKKQFQKKIYGDDRRLYLLFGRDISQSILYNLMDEFYVNNPELYRKTPHDTRHTASTWLASHDYSGTLGKLILGQVDKTQKRYNHLAEQMARVNSREGKDIFDDF